MTNDVKHESVAPMKKTGASGFDKFVIGIIILGFAALVIYQVFFCPTCYGSSLLHQ
jgi:hypothetical protein